MDLIVADSLTDTLDRINDCLLMGQAATPTQKLAAARWLASRTGLPGSYAGLPAATPKDLAGIRLYTGEALTSRASIAHILGQEACRAMLLLASEDATVRNALPAATATLNQRLRERQNHSRGMYCCGKCSAATWRNVLAGGLDAPKGFVTRGLESLKAKRDGAGRWKMFPFYYTLLALTDMDLQAARDEMRYAAPALERLLARKAADKTPYDARRRAVAERVLAAV